MLRRYTEIASAARNHFRAGRGDPVERFVAEAGRYPVFELLGPAAGDNGTPI